MRADRRRNDLAARPLNEVGAAPELEARAADAHAQPFERSSALGVDRALAAS
jgi:hypothetical protein